ncbi:hypothetical protein [Gordonia sp. (in: high G+C Gram-positive bacteria)]|uniref:hypothetical protein n=1 Tax=Gordonia sp. (in: high G+C Gram-positive bacteria) TaxID=84139 RepID=UPI0039E2CE5B
MTTTIKVENAIRDRLKAQAARSGRTLGAQVEYLVDLGDRAVRYEELRAAIAATPPAEIDSYRAEVDDWSGVDR